MKISNIILIFVISLFLIFCQEKEKDKSNKIEESINQVEKNNEDKKFEKIYTEENPKISVKIDSTILFSNIKYDSVFAIDYIGFIGENTFFPLNNNGKWANTISKSIKLTNNQIININSIFNNKESFEKPMNVACFQPRIGLIYFEKGIVVNQTMICIGCARLESTSKFANGQNYTPFNENTLRKFEEICLELEFSDCVHWKDE